MADITIYLGNKKYSSWSPRPWLALKYAGVPFHEVVIPLYLPESAASIRRNSPFGRLPVLHHGEIPVWESLAMCEYLAELFPAARLWPRDRAARAFAHAICSEIHGGFANLPMDLANRWPLGDRLHKAKPDIDRIVANWRECRERFGGAGGNVNGEFLFRGFSIADAICAPVVTRFVTYGVPLDGICQAYVTAAMAWPAMQEWMKSARAEN